MILARPRFHVNSNFVVNTTSKALFELQYGYFLKTLAVTRAGVIAMCIFTKLFNVSPVVYVARCFAYILI